MTNCELCGNNPADRLAYFGKTEADHKNGKWKLACSCAAVSENFHQCLRIDIVSYNINPLEWLCALVSLPWFDRDDFLACLKRERGESRCAPNCE